MFIFVCVGGSCRLAPSSLTNPFEKWQIHRSINILFSWWLQGYIGIKKFIYQFNILVRWPWSNNFRAMVPCVVSWQSISGLELFLTDYTSMGNVQMNFSMPSHQSLVVHCFTTSLTNVHGRGSVWTSWYHRIQERVQV